MVCCILSKRKYIVSHPRNNGVVTDGVSFPVSTFSRLHRISVSDHACNKNLELFQIYIKVVLIYTSNINLSPSRASPWEDAILKSLSFQARKHTWARLLEEGSCLYVWSLEKSAFFCFFFWQIWKIFDRKQLLPHTCGYLCANCWCKKAFVLPTLQICVNIASDIYVYVLCFIRLTSGIPVPPTGRIKF